MAIEMAFAIRVVGGGGEVCLLAAPSLIMLEPRVQSLKRLEGDSSM